MATNGKARVEIWELRRRRIERSSKRKTAMNLSISRLSIARHANEDVDQARTGELKESQASTQTENLPKGPFGSRAGYQEASQ